MSDAQMEAHSPAPVSSRSYRQIGKIVNFVTLRFQRNTPITTSSLTLASSIGKDVTNDEYTVPWLHVK